MGVSGTFHPLASEQLHVEMGGKREISLDLTTDLSFSGYNNGSTRLRFKHLNPHAPAVLTILHQTWHQKYVSCVMRWNSDWNQSFNCNDKILQTPRLESCAPFKNHCVKWLLTVGRICENKQLQKDLDVYLAIYDNTVSRPGWNQPGSCRVLRSHLSCNTYLHP